MQLFLEAITFDHDSTDATVDALSIRRNALVPIAPPEWVRGVTRDEFAASIAAYAVQVVDSKRVTIKVALRHDAEWDTGQADDLPPTIRVRTIDASGVVSCLQSLLGIMRPGGETRLPPSVLGTVPETEVTFGVRGPTIEVLLPLSGTRLPEVGIGKHDVHWIWQWQLAGERTWRTFATTRHRIYTVLGMPTAPWGQPRDADPRRSLPWADALDLVCDWATGVRDIDVATAAITRRLFNMGSERLRYDCDGGVAHYAHGDFHLSALIERLRGGVGNGPRVNCNDCAAAVSTLANVLGADLGAQRMAWGASNVLSLIGAPRLWEPCTGFSYHEVAWSGSNLRTDRVWDACCMLDMDDAPGTIPYAGDTPIALPHSRPWVGSYAWHLSMPFDDPIVQDDFRPFDSSPMRREVF